MANQGEIHVGVGYGRTRLPDKYTPRLENENGVMEYVDDTRGDGFLLDFVADYRLMTNTRGASVGLHLFAGGGFDWQKNGNGIQYSYAGDITDSSILTQSDGTVEDCPDYSCIDTATFNRDHFDGGLGLYLGFGNNRKIGFHHVTLDLGLHIQKAWPRGTNITPVAIEGVPFPGALRQDEYGWALGPEAMLGVLVTPMGKNAGLYWDTTGLWFPSQKVTEKTKDGASTAEVSQDFLGITTGLGMRFGQSPAPVAVAAPAPVEDPDRDRDGLLNDEETQGNHPQNTKHYITNPDDADTDDDGLSDGEEIKTYHTDPTNPDTDADGLKDGEEVHGSVLAKPDYHTVTDPLNPDSDGDELKDGQEVLELDTDPMNRDSDHDGLDDFLETNGGSKIDTDGDGTIDALDLDSDEDTLTDKEEGGNPNAGEDDKAFHDMAQALKRVDCSDVADFRNADDDCDTIQTKKEVQDAKDLGARKINDGKEPADADGDGKANWYDTNSDGDAKPDSVELDVKDTDGDGILDYMDAIDQIQTVYITRTEIKITDRIHFEFNSDVIRPISFDLLRKIAVVMNSPDAEHIKTIEIQGHADPEGNDVYNMDLSQRRAESVMKWLIETGKVDSNRLVSAGYGETVLRDPNTDITYPDEAAARKALKTRAKREAFRRVEFHIVKGSE